MSQVVENVEEPIRFLPFAEVKSRVGLSRAEIYRRMAAQTFPKSIPLSEKRVAWIESEIAAWQKKILQAAGRA